MKEGLWSGQLSWGSYIRKALPSLFDRACRGSSARMQPSCIYTSPNLQLYHYISAIGCLRFKPFLPGTCAEPSIRYELNFTISLEIRRGMVAREPWLSFVSASYMCPRRCSFLNNSYGQYHAAFQAKSRRKLFGTICFPLSVSKK
jgi:hypothetical protein